jgi:hypothetical protein
MQPHLKVLIHNLAQACIMQIITLLRNSLQRFQQETQNMKILLA